MALINCKECNKEISDLAVSCPNCGAPVKKKEPPIDKWVPIEDKEEHIGSQKGSRPNKKINPVFLLPLILTFITGAFFYEALAPGRAGLLSDPSLFTEERRSSAVGKMIWDDGDIFNATFYNTIRGWFGKSVDLSYQYYIPMTKYSKWEDLSPNAKWLHCKLIIAKLLPYIIIFILIIIWGRAFDQTYKKPNIDKTID